VDRLTRKELKSDRFALEVQHSIQVVSDHRQQLTRWGTVVGVVAILVIAVMVYRNHQHTVRQEALHASQQLQNATIGQQPPGSEFSISFPTQAARDQAVNKSFTELAAKYSGTDEGLIAEFFLGTNAADQGKLPKAEKRLKQVADAGIPYSALAKVSLAQVYAAEGKLPEGEKLMQSLIDHPTPLVSKETATILLAELLQSKDSARARKLLEPLRSSPRSGVSRVAISALSDMSQK
jgi:predicted negative regulator of RcsB-dependent stress response